MGREKKKKKKGEKKENAGRLLGYRWVISSGLPILFFSQLGRKKEKKKKKVDSDHREKKDKLTVP